MLLKGKKFFSFLKGNIFVENNAYGIYDTTYISTNSEVAIPNYTVIKYRLVLP